MSICCSVLRQLADRWQKLKFELWRTTWASSTQQPWKAPAKNIKRNDWTFTFVTRWSVSRLSQYHQVAFQAASMLQRAGCSLRARLLFLPCLVPIRLPLLLPSPLLLMLLVFALLSVLCCTPMLPLHRLVLGSGLQHRHLQHASRAGSPECGSKDAHAHVRRDPARAASLRAFPAAAPPPPPPNPARWARRAGEPPRHRQPAGLPAARCRRASARGR